MKKIYTGIILFLVFQLSGLPQGVAIYSVSRATGITFTSISTTGTSVTSWRSGSNTNNNRSNPVPIGFYFNYLGTLYSTVSVSTNGFIDFSTSSATGSQDKPYGYDNTAFSIPSPNGTLLALAPFYDDLAVTTGFTLSNSVKYLTTGVPGNQVFTLEWINFSFALSNIDHVNFQVRLYEADASIEFVYGSMNASGIIPSYTCGINGPVMSNPPESDQLLTQQSPNSSYFGTTPQNNLNIIPESFSNITLWGCILPLVPETITGPLSLCQSSNGITYTVPPVSYATSYNWTFPEGFTMISGFNTNTVVVNAGANAVTGEITVAGVNDCGFGNALVRTVTINARPVPAITGPSVACAGTGGYLYTTEPSMSNYQWTVTSGGTITGGIGTNTISVTWNTEGIDSVRVNYINASGCAAKTPSKIPVYVTSRPVPVIAGPDVVCANSVNNLYYTSPGMTDYTWTVSTGGTITGGGTSTSSSVVVTWTLPGARYVSVAYTSPTGCTSQTPTVYPVTVNPLPVPVISGPASVCVNTSNNHYTTQSGMYNYVWQISPGGTITSGGSLNDTSIMVTWLTAGPQSVSVNYTNPNGCTGASATVYNVTVNERPSPSLTGPSIACVGSSNYIYNTQTGMTNYIWGVSAGGTIVSGGTSTSSMAIIAWNTVGPQTVSINYTNSYGCTALAVFNYPVNVAAVPVPSLTGPDQACAGSVNNVYYTQPGMVNYTWTVSPGGTITAGGTSSSASVTITWNTPGNQAVSVGYTSSEGCVSASPVTYPVVVHALPIPIITGPGIVCSNTGGHLYKTQPGMINYQWQISPGGQVTQGGGMADSTVTVTWITPGTQTVSANYTDLHGCTAVIPTSYSVTVNDRPVPVIGGAADACTGSVNTYSTENGMSNYLWEVSPGGTVISGGTSTSPSVTVQWTGAGSQWVGVNYTNPQGCSGLTATNYPVNVHTLPVPFLSGPVTICQTSPGNKYITNPGMFNYTWLVSAGGTITAGGTATSDSVVVTWNNPGSAEVAVTYTDAQGCTTATPAVLPVTVNPLPVPSLHGPANTCVGSTGNVYFTQSGNLNYAWQISGGGTITQGGSSSDTLVYVTWNTTGPQSVSVNYFTPQGCTAVSPAIMLVTVSDRPVPVVTGPDTVCAGSVNNTYVTESGMSNYRWVVTPGGTITDGGTTNSNYVTVTWNSVGAQAVLVNYNNAAGCPALTYTSFPVIVRQQPVPGLTGPSAVCVVTAGHLYRTEPGMTDYAWNVSAGGTITGGGTVTSDTVVVTWNLAGPQSVSVNYVNSIGCPAGTPTVYPVSVEALPVPVIAGPAAVCIGSTGNVYSTETGMINYSWTVSSGGVITSGTGTSAITVTWSTTGDKTVSVSYSTPTGCAAPVATVYPVNVQPLPVPVIIGPNAGCTGYSGYIYSTQAGMSSYFWNISPGGTIVSGWGTDSVAVNWNQAGIQNISVNYTTLNGCSAITPTVKQVTVSTIPVPVISGNTNPCLNAGLYPYSTEAGMTGYQWSASPGGIIVSGSATNTVNVNWIGSGPQWIRVNYTTPAGCTAIIPTTLNVTVRPAPGEPGPVTGPVNVCKGSSGIPYSVDSISNALTYIWNLPPGATIATGSGTRSVTVNYSLNASSGDITVLGNNGCGGGPLSPPLTVTVNNLVPPSGPVTGPDTVARGASGLIYSITPLPYVITYNWTLPSGVSIVSGSGTSAVTVDITPDAVSGQVSVFGINNCGNGNPSPPFPLTVVPFPAPPVIIQSGDSLISNYPVGNQWLREGLPIAGATGRSYHPVQTGWHSAILIHYGVQSDTSNRIYFVMTGNNEHAEQALSVYPVPNNGRFFISAPVKTETICTLTVYNTAGIEVFETDFLRLSPATEKSVDLGPLPNGVYTVVIRNNDWQSVRKIVINR